jgi:hypothetical protein
MASLSTRIAFSERAAAMAAWAETICACLLLRTTILIPWAMSARLFASFIPTSSIKRSGILRGVPESSDCSTEGSKNT